VSNVGWEGGQLAERDPHVRYDRIQHRQQQEPITSLPGGDQINAAWRHRSAEWACRSTRTSASSGRHFPDGAKSRWATQNAKTGPGDLKYKDQNGDGKIDARSRGDGRPFPHYTFGSNMTAQWKNFDASMLLQGVAKQDVFLDGALIEGPTWENFFSTYLLDSWTPENPNAKWPRFVFRDDHNQNAPGSNSWYVRNGKYLSLKNLNFGYALPDRLAGRVGLQPRASMSPAPTSRGRRSRESSRRKRIRVRPARPTTTRRATGASERASVSNERLPLILILSFSSNEIEISHSGRPGPDPAVHRLSVV
jgi:hypothetical protein